MGIKDEIEVGMSHATPTTSCEERYIANCLYDELSNQWMGRGLTCKGSGQGDDGRSTVVVSGSVDLVALARRAIRAVGELPAIDHLRRR